MSFLIWLVALIVTHEGGHALVAILEGKFAGFGLFPLPHVNVEGGYLYFWDYLSGMVASLVTYPLFNPWWFAGYFWGWNLSSFQVFLMVILFTGCVDIILMLGEIFDSSYTILKRLPNRIRNRRHGR